MTQGHGSVSAPVPDPIFDGLFADAVASTGGPLSPDDETTIHRGVLRPYLPVDETVLAGSAAESALVTDALRLANWVGEGQTLTPEGRLTPEAAQAAATAVLGLDLSGSADSADSDDSDDWAGLADPADSADRLDELQVLWSATVAAGLIDCTSSIASPGAGLQTWLSRPDQPDRPDAATARARLDSWGRLVVGLLRARAEGSDEDALGGLELASTPIYYTLGRDPIPAGLPALVLAALPDEADDVDPVWMYRQLPAAIDVIARDWAWAGVLAPVESLTADDVDTLDELFETFTDERDDAAAAAALVQPLVEAVQASPIVRLSPLGGYGLRRILLAHGWQVPLVGEAATVPPSRLLDLLVAYLPEDALDEAEIWLAAQGNQWQRALHQVAMSARSKKPDEGPARRAVLASILRMAGPRVEPLLADLATDPWLAALVADTRFELEIGPEPTLAEELWLIVDGISAALDGDDEERAEAVEDSAVLEFLRLPGALTAAANLAHPHTRYVLELIADVSGDQQLAHHLRRALGTEQRSGKGAKRKRPSPRR